MVKNLPTNAGDMGDTYLIPGSGRSPGERNGNPLQYSCLENPMDRRAYGSWIRKSWTQLSAFFSFFLLSEVNAQSSLTLCNPLDYTVHEIL